MKKIFMIIHIMFSLLCVECMMSCENLSAQTSSDSPTWDSIVSKHEIVSAHFVMDTQYIKEFKRTKDNKKQWVIYNDGLNYRDVVIYLERDDWNKIRDGWYEYIYYKGRMEYCKTCSEYFFGAEPTTYLEEPDYE